MAPSLEEPVQVEYTANHSWPTKVKIDPHPSLFESYVPGRTPIAPQEPYQHNELLPRFPNIHWPALEEVPYQDKGIQGDINFRNLLAEATEVVDYNPKIGTDVSGVRLAHLTDTQKNDLARLIATRGVVFFRNQDDFDIEAQRELGKYFGTLHKV